MLSPRRKPGPTGPRRSVGRVGPGFRRDDKKLGQSRTVVPGESGRLTCGRASRGDGGAEFAQIAAMTAAAPSLPESARPRQAWLALAGAFTAFTLSAAIMHSYPVYLVAFIAEFGWSRGETSIAYSVSQLVAGASSPLVGSFISKW